MHKTHVHNRIMIYPWRSEWHLKHVLGVHVIWIRIRSGHVFVCENKASDVTDHSYGKTNQAPVAEASVSNATSLGKDTETLTCINKPYIQYSFTPVLSEDLTHTCDYFYLCIVFSVLGAHQCPTPFTELHFRCGHIWPNLTGEKFIVNNRTIHEARLTQKSNSFLSVNAVNQSFTHFRILSFLI